MVLQNRTVRPKTEQVAALIGGLVDLRCFQGFSCRLMTAVRSGILVSDTQRPFNL